MTEEILAVMYADDSNLFNEGRNLEDMENRMNHLLDKISVWLKVNKLTLNIDKTHFIIFRNKNKLIDYEPCLKIDEKPIHRVTSTKFLGVYVDEHLTWKVHIDYICKKVSKSIGILLKARRYLNQNTLQQLYYTFIYPYLSYCNHIWGKTYSSYIHRLLVLQKRAIRIITFSRYKAHTSQLFQNLKILKCQEINVYLRCQFMYKYKEGSLPKIFNDMFIVNADVHTLNTRSSNKFHISKVKTELGKISLRYHGAILWNKIMDCLNTASSFYTFKNELKSYLLSEQK